MTRACDICAEPIEGVVNIHFGPHGFVYSCSQTVCIEAIYAPGSEWLATEDEAAAAYEISMERGNG